MPVHTRTCHICEANCGLISESISRVAITSAAAAHASRSGDDTKTRLTKAELQRFVADTFQVEWNELTRDVEAIQIPSGDEIHLPAGTRVMITQALGGKWHGSYGLAFCPAHHNTVTAALSVGTGREGQLLLCEGS